jgi:hypothetical protein
MKKIDLSGGTVVGLMVGSVVIAAASMVVSLVAVAGADPEPVYPGPPVHRAGGAVGHGGAAGPAPGGHVGVGHEGAMGPAGAGHAERLAATAGYLGLEPEDLRTQLKEGATIAELAGDDLDGLIAQQLELAGEHLGTAVADGRIDQARADEILSGLSERITARMNGEMPGGMTPGSMGGMRPGGMGGGHKAGMGGGHKAGMGGMRPGGMGGGHKAGMGGMDHGSEGHGT